jgi:RHS repeat-associated protein
VVVNWSPVTCTPTTLSATKEYDANGNLVREVGLGGVTEYFYDTDNRLTKVIHPNGAEDFFDYSHGGDLMQKVQGGVTIQYVYSDGPAPIAQYNVNTGEWTNNLMVNGEIWGMEDSTGAKYFHKDVIGNVIAISDQNGTVTDTFTYDPWGNLLHRTGTTQTDYGFVGGHGVRQLPNGQMVMGRRIYDPAIGRFTTKDPIGYAGLDSNFYRYCFNRPMNCIDETGLRTTIITTYDRFLWFKYGSHSAVHVTNNTNPTMYDPGGTYMAGGQSGSGYMISGAGADVQLYRKYKESSGSQVSIKMFDTTPEEERQIVSNIENAPKYFPLTCGKRVSNVLKGVGPFKELGTYFFPASLDKALDKR